MGQASRPSRPWPGYALWLLAVGLAANAVLGPLGTGTIAYHYSPSLINQAIGLDGVTLIAAVPVAVLAARLWLRGHPAGPVLAFLPATFTAYMVPQYVVGPDYLGLPGNNERFFLFHVVLFVLAVMVVLAAWAQIGDKILPPASAAADRRRSWVMFGVAAFILLGRWLPGIAELTGGDPSSVDYRENPTAYLLIGVLDLGLVVPAAVVAGVGLRVGARRARNAAYAVIGWFALVPVSVAAMAVTMQLRGDPNASTSTTVLFLVAATVFTVGALILYRPLFDMDSVALVEPRMSELARGCG
jgi:hypothetical protein